MENTEWLRTDLREEAITSLELVAELMSEAPAHAWLWKWAVIAMDNALQNLFVLAVAHTSGLNVIAAKDSDLKAWRDGEGAYPEGNLLPFLKLFKKVQREEMLKYVDSRPLQIAPEEDRAVRRLHRMRNGFIHYAPLSLSIEVGWFHEVLGASVEVARRLVFETGTIMWDRANQEDRVRSALSAIADAFDP